jgi:hypothetical protein
LGIDTTGTLDLLVVGEAALPLTCVRAGVALELVEGAGGGEIGGRVMLSCGRSRVMLGGSEAAFRFTFSSAGGVPVGAEFCSAGTEGRVADPTSVTGDGLATGTFNTEGAEAGRVALLLDFVDGVLAEEDPATV